MKKPGDRSFWYNYYCHLHRSLDKIQKLCLYCYSSSTLSLSLSLSLSACVLTKLCQLIGAICFIFLTLWLYSDNDWLTSHNLITVRTYVFHMLGSYVNILCNWLILWQNTLYLQLGSSRIFLILQETIFQDKVLKSSSLSKKTSWKCKFIKTRQLAW